MKIIIVEDEAIIRLDLREILVEAGHEVIAEARNAKDAIEVIERLQPDAIFLDVQLDTGNGCDVLKAFADKRIAPIIMVTAFSRDVVIAQAQELGAMAFITKPFAQSDIIPALQVAVARFEESKMLAREIDELQDRLATRKVVDRARGILMKKGLSEADAYSKLQKAAMDSGRKLKDVSEAVILADDLGV